MSAVPIEQYAKDLVQSVIASAEAESLSAHDVFAEQVIGDLESAGIVDDGFVAYYKAHGVEISGYGHAEGINALDLFLVNFREHPLLQKIGKTEVTGQARRTLNYLAKVAKGLKKEIDDSSDAFDMALAVEYLLTTVASIRVFLITNDVSSIRRYKGEQFGELPVTFEVWDLNRLHRMATSGLLHEPIAVDFDPPLPCLSTPQTADDYSVFLSIVPGEVLGRVYSEYGSRLLELNVRSFLQLKGAVNRGIRETLLTSPERFLAYNNGISATASKVDLVRLPSGEQAIKRIHDLQIVNGGQTTASIHNSFAKKEGDLSNVLVQMKLTQVNPRMLEEIVPEISKYSNTQNKVTVVDFSSNHPFHVELEKVTRALWAPAVDGSGQETKWFYERARGQYADALNKERTPAKQKQFRLIHPLQAEVRQDRRGQVGELLEPVPSPRFTGGGEELPCVHGRDQPHEVQPADNRSRLRGATARQGDPVQGERAGRYRPAVRRIPSQHRHVHDREDQSRHRHANRPGSHLAGPVRHRRAGGGHRRGLSSRAQGHHRSSGWDNACRRMDEEGRLLASGPADGVEPLEGIGGRAHSPWQGRLGQTRGTSGQSQRRGDPRDRRGDGSVVGGLVRYLPLGQRDTEPPAVATLPGILAGQNRRSSR